MWHISGALLAFALLLAPLRMATAAAEFLYVANNHDGTISVIAIPEFEVVAEIDVLSDQSVRATRAGTYADDVVLSADGTRLYVSRGGLRDVAAFALPAGDLLWKLPTDGLADHFALSADGGVLFVSVYSEDRVHVIDTAEGQELARIASCSGPHGMRFSADGRRVYNGCMIGDAIDVIDAATFEVTRRYNFLEGVRPFEISADESKAWVQLTRLHGLVELDLDEGRVTKTIHLPVPPGITAQQDFPHTAHHGLALTPDGTRLCAAGTVADYVAVLSVPELDLIATVPVAGEPSWIVPSLDGRYCYVSSRKGDTVSVISVAEGNEVARVKVGSYPQRMWVIRAPL
ncbi:MAG: beta-propeller fold lactonase family protein [Gammaproteobacteria bacterium]|nr:beta-propeller fold lactonase family protein [Gammaproteobacteria bacterium]